MNTVDIILSLVLLYGLVRGFFRGLLAEVASLIGIIAGIYGAIHLSHFLGDFLSIQLEWRTQYINLISFAFTFVIIVVLVSLAGKILTKVAAFAALGIVNKLLGGVFGLIKSAFVASVIIMFFKATNEHIEIVEDQSLEESILYDPVESIAPILLPSIIKQVKERDLLNSNDEEQFSLI
ncbi:CvpA family protein [Christiangramia echinicola]|uniref:Membrane protein required for colicin V production n=1 Tax=Christiangramia echinicola TaxID=279359 RepID=A0A1H1MPV0_9FLAO|nr:CvpA family protein [Christiangramia echinicola]SDR88682.1 membrane protein required for colicin V production [Christiangramia echinicola]